MIKVTSEVKTITQMTCDLPGPIALVPTMGALHEGHLALIRRARQLVGPDGTVAVSIFVNPIQFDSASDLTNYPRPLKSDLALCEKEGVDLAFTPEKEFLYHSDHSVILTESLLSKGLCGSSRSGHFDGVLTVVIKLFNLLQPTLAIFGEKDFQQIALIRRMVRDLNIPVKIVGHPTVRELDGLALSSRNIRLTQEHRKDAPRIQRALSAASHLAVNGEQNPAAYLIKAKKHLLANAPDGFSIEYLELIDAESMEAVSLVTKPAVLATACYYGEIRLIDHVKILTG
ncbi:pantoate--beta-alanine ligase [Akkermansiaceae bacterium]|nr:pantoate--beta-alanine ligase [Akkermansiaceae bacterium]